MRFTTKISIPVLTFLLFQTGDCMFGRLSNVMQAAKVAETRGASKVEVSQVMKAVASGRSCNEALQQILVNQAPRPVPRPVPAPAPVAVPSSVSQPVTQPAPAPVAVQVTVPAVASTSAALRRITSSASVASQQSASAFQYTLPKVQDSNVETGRQIDGWLFNVLISNRMNVEDENLNEQIFRNDRDSTGSSNDQSKTDDELVVDSSSDQEDFLSDDQTSGNDEEFIKQLQKSPADEKERREKLREELHEKLQECSASLKKIIEIEKGEKHWCKQMLERNDELAQKVIAESRKQTSEDNGALQEIYEGLETQYKDFIDFHERPNRLQQAWGEQFNESEQKIVADVKKQFDQFQQERNEFLQKNSDEQPIESQQKIPGNEQQQKESPEEESERTFLNEEDNTEDSSSINAEDTIREWIDKVVGNGKVSKKIWNSFLKDHDGFGVLRWARANNKVELNAADINEVIAKAGDDVEGKVNAMYQKLCEALDKAKGAYKVYLIGDRENPAEGTIWRLFNDFRDASEDEGKEKAFKNFLDKHKNDLEKNFLRKDATWKDVDNVISSSERKIISDSDRSMVLDDKRDRVEHLYGMFTGSIEEIEITPVETMDIDLRDSTGSSDEQDIESQRKIPGNEQQSKKSLLEENEQTFVNDEDGTEISSLNSMSDSLSSGPNSQIENFSYFPKPDDENYETFIGDKENPAPGTVRRLGRDLSGSKSPEEFAKILDNFLKSHNCLSDLQKIKLNDLGNVFTSIVEMAMNDDNIRVTGIYSALKIAMEVVNDFQGKDYEYEDLSSELTERYSEAVEGWLSLVTKLWWKGS